MSNHKYNCEFSDCVKGFAMTDLLHLRVRKRKTKSKRIGNKPKLSYKVLVRAMKGTGGNMKVMAERVGRSYSCIYGMMSKAPDWVKEEFRIERERVADIAEETVMEGMQQRIDFATATRTALAVLKSVRHKNRGFAEDKNITLQGGKDPIKIQNENLIPMDKLKSIPLSVRKEMLVEIEEEEDEGEE